LIRVLHSLGSEVPFESELLSAHTPLKSAEAEDLL